MTSVSHVQDLSFRIDLRRPDSDCAGLVKLMRMILKLVIFLSLILYPLGFLLHCVPFLEAMILWNILRELQVFLLIRICQG